MELQRHHLQQRVAKPRSLLTSCRIGNTTFAARPAYARTTKVAACVHYINMESLC